MRAPRPLSREQFQTQSHLPPRQTVQQPLRVTSSRSSSGVHGVWSVLSVWYEMEEPSDSKEASSSYPKKVSTMTGFGQKGRVSPNPGGRAASPRGPLRRSHLSCAAWPHPWLSVSLSWGSVQLPNLRPRGLLEAGGLSSAEKRSTFVVGDPLCRSQGSGTELPPCR